MPAEGVPPAVMELLQRIDEAVDRDGLAGYYKPGAARFRDEVVVTPKGGDPIVFRRAYAVRWIHWTFVRTADASRAFAKAVATRKRGDIPEVTFLPHSPGAITVRPL